MKRKSKAFAFAALALLLAGRARAGQETADAGLAAADEFARQADAAAARVRTAASGDCAPDETIPTLMEGFAANRFGKVTADDLPDRAKTDIRLYYSCRALAADDSKDCKDLAILNGVYTYDSAGNRSGQVDPEVLDAAETEKVKENATHDARCVARFKRERMVHAMIVRDPRAAEYCRIYVDDRKEIRADAADEACRLITSQPKDREALCRTLTPLFIRPATMPFCLQLISELDADPRACPQVFGGFFPTHTCEQLGQYRRAFERKKPSLCEGGMCRMWAGGGAAACDYYGPIFQAAACRLAAPAVVLSEGEVLAGLVAKAEGALNEAEGRVEYPRGVRGADEIDARAEKLARLLAGSEAALDRARAAAPEIPASGK